MDNSSIEIERGSERNFGITFAVVFALIGTYRLWVAGEVLWWSFAVALVMLATAVLYPAILRVPNLLWFKLGMLLAMIIGPLVMALVYVVTLVPMGLIVRLLGKDMLHLKLDPDTNSYWIKRESPPEPMKNQF